MAPDELTWRHHVAHYTLLPLVVVVYGGSLLVIPLYLFGHVSEFWMVVVPWLCLWIVCVWIHFFGDYVIPNWTHRKIRRGEL